MQNQPLISTDDRRNGPPALVVVCTIVLAAALTACEKKQEPQVHEVVRPVKMLTLESKARGLARKYPGRVRASQRVDLAFQVPGQVIEMPVEEGQRVEKDQLLARLDPRNFKNNLLQAEGQLKKARAGLELARSELQRVLNIQAKDPGAVSGSMIDQRRESVDRAQAEITSARASVTYASDQLQYTYLRAAFDGVVSRRHVDNFQEVQAKQPIVSLDDTDIMEIVIDVPEIAVARVKNHAYSRIYAEFAAAEGKRYNLTVKEFATRADPRTQTYQVTLQMPQPQEITVLPGMTATVTAEVDERGEQADVFVVPALAVTADSAGAPQVWVVDPETSEVSPRKVAVGELTGEDRVQIRSGLKNGETIAVTGVTRLRDGMQVRNLREVEGFDR